MPVPRERPAMSIVVALSIIILAAMVGAHLTPIAWREIKRRRRMRIT